MKTMTPGFQWCEWCELPPRVNCFQPDVFPLNFFSNMIFALYHGSINVTCSKTHDAITMETVAQLSLVEYCD